MMAAKKQSYEENIAEIDKILEKFENEELLLDDSIAEYEKAKSLRNEKMKTILSVEQIEMLENNN